MPPRGWTLKIDTEGGPGMTRIDLSLKAVFTRISVLFIYLLNIETTLINSALADIARAFPDADPTAISLISTIPNIVSITIAFLILPQLVKVFNKRSIVLTALVIYIIGGLGGAFFNDSVLELLLGRAFLGIGVGLSAPLCGAIINELYEGLEKNTLIGWSNAVDSCVAIVLTMIAGYLCTSNWQYTFFAYGFFIIVLMMEYYYLPSMPVPMVRDAMGAAHRPKIAYTPKQWLKLVLVLAYALTFSLCLMTLMLKTAIFVADQGLGDALVTASIMSFLTAGIMLASFVFGFVEIVTRRYTIVLSPACVAAGAFMMFHSGSVATLVASGFVAGLGLGLFIPSCTTRVLAIGPVFNGTFANSLLVGLNGLGVFLAAFTEKLIGIVLEPTPKNMVGAVGALFLMMAAVSLAYVIWNPLDGVNEEPLAPAPI
jgi:MFS family permease